MIEIMSIPTIDEALAQITPSDTGNNNSIIVNSGFFNDDTVSTSGHDSYYGYNSESENSEHLTEQKATLTRNQEKFEGATGKVDTVELCKNESKLEKSKSQCEDNLASDLLSLNNELEKRVDDEQMYIWYASYGSNMWKDRFMCYLQGGKVETMNTICLGSRNKAPPVDTSWMQVQNQMFFGRSYTRAWGHGGVAFLETTPTAGVSTYIRMYKIMLGQFNDIFLQENHILDYDRDLIKPDFVRALGQQPSSPTLSTLVKESWYGTILHLGEQEGVPILTFTCSLEDLHRFHSGLLPLCFPSEAYQGAIARGLIEDLGLSKDAALAYVFSKVSSC